MVKISVPPRNPWFQSNPQVVLVRLPIFLKNFYSFSKNNLRASSLEHPPSSIWNRASSIEEFSIICVGHFMTADIFLKFFNHLAKIDLRALSASGGLDFFTPSARPPPTVSGPAIRPCPVRWRSLSNWGRSLKIQQTHDSLTTNNEQPVP